MNNYKHDFGKRFRAFRKAAGLTQKEVAEKLGYSSHVAIFKIENGRQDVPISLVPKICQVLQCDPLQLLGIHDDYSAPHPEGSNIMERIDKLPASKRNELVNIVDILIKGVEDKENG